MRVKPLDLTAGTRWRFRCLNESGPGPWASSFARALASQTGRQVAVPWPTTWRSFSRIQAIWPVRQEQRPDQRELPDATLFKTLLNRLCLDGEELDRIDLRATGGQIDLANAFGAPRNLRCAWLFAEHLSVTAQELIIHTGADWWHEWFVDGVAVFDTLLHGNRSPLLDTAHQFTLRLEPGLHHLAVRVFSGGAGWAFATCATRALTARRGLRSAPALGLQAERNFHVEDPTVFAGLVFTGETATRVTLNGHPLPLPEAGMRYQVIPGIPPQLLAKGLNRLEYIWAEEAVVKGIPALSLRPFRHSGSWQRLTVAGALCAFTPAAVRITSGPIVGHATSTMIALSCRTQVRCAVTLDLAGQRQVSKPGLIHQFRVHDLQPNHAVHYRLTPGSGVTTFGRTRTLPERGPLDIAIYGDPSPQPQVLAQVLDRIHAARPRLALALGDLTSDGCYDALWDREYLSLLPKFFRSTPHLWVIGNHEEGCPIFNRLFATPGGERDWTTVIGGCRFIGIDGLQDWTVDSDRYRWLAVVLAAAKERFIVFVNHYPAWSSTPHGANGADGAALQRTVREARDCLLPLLAKHRVSLAFNGHAHCYERTLSPEGVTCITTGGAGGFLYPDVPDRGVHNPYRQVFVARHHWCRLRILPEALELTAIDLEGQLIDTFTYVGAHTT